MPFHGRTVRGWVLGPAAEPPAGRLLPVRKVRSPVRFFDEGSLPLLRWISERYLAPLATVIERSCPPRVAGIEREVLATTGEGVAAEGRHEVAASGLAGVDLDAMLAAGTTSWYRPLPGREAEAAVAAVRACLARGRRAIVIVPEAGPVPGTAWAVLEAFGERVVSMVGGSERARYRAWLRVRSSRVDVVVGTRPAVLAPVRELGLVYVSREVHPGHREDRAPYYHVRDVATARARLEGAAVVLASLSPSVETVAAVAAGEVREVRHPRPDERRAMPLVETAAPAAEDRSPRLGQLLRAAGSAALIVSRRGYGIARVCRACRAPAACAACGGVVVVEAGEARCRVCAARGRCAVCGGEEFGVERGGVERIAEWAGRASRLPVDLEAEPANEAPGEVEGERGGVPVARGPSAGRILVGTAAAVHDVDGVRMDLVAILDPDRALARAGLHAGERALATWMEAAAWAGPRAEGGRVLAQTRHPGHPAIQALVRWEPVPFLRWEGRRRGEAGFPPGHPVFRLTGPREPGDGPALAHALRGAGAGFVLETSGAEGTVCLVAVPPTGLASFRAAVLRLVAEGRVGRVEADPHL